MDFDLDRTIPILERTPPALQALLRGLPDEWTRGNEGPDTFSAFDVVGHLIDSEETNWIPRARIILAQEPGSQFVPYDRFRHRARNSGRTLSSLLDEFSALRAVNLGILRSWDLPPETLDLANVHPDLGRVTLRQLLSTWAVHDLGHLAQTSRVMAKQYRDAAGPWVRFLPVLTDHDPPRS